MTFKLPEAYLEAIDWLVKSGRYRSRSDVIRAAVARLVREEHMLIERGLRVSVEEIV